MFVLWDAVFIAQLLSFFTTEIRNFPSLPCVAKLWSFIVKWSWLLVVCWYTVAILSFRETVPDCFNAACWLPVGVQSVWSVLVKEQQRMSHLIEVNCDKCYWLFRHCLLLILSGHRHSLIAFWQDHQQSAAHKSGNLFYLRKCQLLFHAAFFIQFTTHLKWDVRWLENTMTYFDFHQMFILAHFTWIW